MNKLRVEYDDERNFELVVIQHTPGARTADKLTPAFNKELARVTIKNLEVQQKIEQHEDTETDELHDMVVESTAILAIDMKKLEIVKRDG